MKKILSIVLALSLMLGIPALAAAGEGDLSLDYIIDKGELIMGLDDTFAPMGYRNEDNEIVGYDIDLATEVCARMGVELVLQPIEWAANQLELSTKNIDCIWNGMSINPERAEGMALSDAYMNNAMVFVVKNPDYTSREDLAGKPIALQSGSQAERMLNSEEFDDFRNSLSDVVAHENYTLALMDLQNGNVEGVLIDLVVANYHMAEMGDDSLFVIDNLGDDLYAVGFRKEDIALRDKVNEILHEMAEDGTMAEISEKWFGTDISIIGTEAE